MPRLSVHPRLLLVLLCLLALGVQASGAHLHVCLEGSDPPSAWHMHPDVDGHHSDEAHIDVDIHLAGHSLPKKAGLDQDPLSESASIDLSPLLSSRNTTLDLPEPTAAAVRSAYHLRPPLRGPPA